MWDAPENYSAGVVPSTWRAVAGCSSALADKIEKDLLRRLAIAELPNFGTKNSLEPIEAPQLAVGMRWNHAGNLF